jgi:hypothetical protein
METSGDRDEEVRQLPLPRSGRIHAIVHLADLHIRSGNREACRFDDYAAVFDNLVKSVTEHPAVRDGRAVCVIAGDCFHHKDVIQTSGAILFGKILDQLSSLMPVYLLPGNHDYRSSTQHDEDMLSAFCAIAARPNVACLTKTGLYQADRVGFGLLDIRDVRVPGSDSGHVVPASARAAFPDPRRFSRADVDVTAALFHGAVSDARLPGGSRCADVSDTLEADQAFAGYDIALLGDIHAQQMGGGGCDAVDASMVATSFGAARVFQGSFGRGGGAKTTVWAYPGSTVQQTFGEAVIGHGYILWDLLTKTATAFHVPGATGMVTAHRRADDGTWMVHRLIHGPEHTPLDDAVRTPGFPREVMVRVQGGDADDARDLVRALEDEGVKVTHTRFCAAVSMPAAGGGGGDVGDFGAASLEWIPYVKEYAREEAALQDTEWERWLEGPGELVVPTDLLQNVRLPDLSAAVIQRNLVIGNKAMQAQDVMKHLRGSNRRIPFLLKMTWSNLLCYGEDNRFDFTKYRGEIVTLSAPNSGGKTTFAETICWALYGEGFPSRKAVVNPNNIRRAKGARNACTSITFRLQERTYQLQRTFQSGNKRAVKQRGIILQELDNAGHVLANGAQRLGASSVNDWIKDNMVSLPQYLATVMLTQTNEVEFFRLKSAEQTDFLVKALGLDAVNALIDVFRESALAHENVCKHVRTAESTLEMAKGAPAAPVLTTSALRSAESAAEAVKQAQARRDALQEDLQRLRMAWSSGCFDLKDLQAACDQPQDLEDQLANAKERAATLSEFKLEEDAYRVARDWSALLRQQLAGGEDAVLDDVVEEDEEEDAPATTVPKPDMSRAECKRVLHEHQAWMERESRRPAPDLGQQDLAARLQEAQAACQAAREAYDQALRAWESHCTSRPPAATATEDDESSWRTALVAARSEGLKLLPRQRRPPIDAFCTKPIQAWAAECEKNACLARKLEDQLAASRARLQDSEGFVTAYEAADHPYNADCAACRAQTHRQQYESQVSLREDLAATCERLEKRLSKGGSSQRWQDRAASASAWITSYEALEDRADYFADQARLRDSAQAWEATLGKLEAAKRAAQVARDRVEAELEDARCAEEASHRMTLAERAQAQLELNDAYENACALRHKRERTRKALTLQELTRQLSDHEEAEQAAADARRLADLIDASRAFGKYTVTRERLVDAEAALQDATKDLGAVECAAGYDAAAAEHRDALRRALDTLKRRTDAIQCVERLLRAFAADCERLAVDLVTQEANRVLEWAGQADLRLCPRWSAAGELLWYVEDQRGTAVRVEAQGGYVRFIAGLAVRVAVARAGVNAVGTQQLLVDEGWTAADTENLAQVPLFLQGLLKRYTTIILMSHLDTVRDAAHVQVVIDRDARGNSVLVG